MENTLIKPVLFVTNEYAENPTHVRLTFDEKDYDRIVRVMILVKEHDLFSANIDFSAELLEEVGEGEYEESDFKPGVSFLTCYQNNCYLNVQNSYDSSIQFETDEITLDEILELIAENFKQK